MKIFSIANNICFAISIACLGVGYIMDGFWMAMPAFLVLILFWMVMKKRLAFWSASSILFVYIFLAAIGVIVKLSMPLLVVGCTAALASWDLAQFNQSMVGCIPLEAKSLVGKYHLQSIGAMFGASLLLGGFTSYIRVQFPFGVTAFLVLIVLGGLTFGMQNLMKNH